jgi:hypothetical protein
MISDDNIVFNENYKCNFCTDGRAYQTVENYARYSFPYFSNKKDDEVKTILVIGAYEGQEITYYLHKYKNATIYAFEPIESVFNRLVNTFGSIERVKLYNFAVADFTGESNFYILSSNLNNTADGSSSLLEFHADKLGHNYKIGNIVKVKTIKLDDIEELSNKDIDYMQVDVQGAELLVLKGSTKILKNVKTLMLEVKTEEYTEAWDAPDFQMYKGMCYLQDLIDFLKYFNIKPYLVGVDNESKNGQGNSFWIRS